ncbi:hypothetical protein DM50_3371 [Burkholderia mallei]|nr:hypothetical protein DM45_3356 [Burkholderia mallei]KOT02646.1 hypothetical protein DM50_3371 [Burkholderia mallei]KOT10967.1 hypothetical protein DM77_2830 [Burkholderia mallei]
MIGARVPPRKSPPERGLFCARATARQRPRRSDDLPPSIGPMGF